MIWDALNSLSAWLCKTIYPLIAYAYKLFYNIGVLRIIKNDKIEPIYQRITLILGLVMLFVITFQLIQYIMEPDNFTDKEKGFGKVMVRMVVSVVLIAVVPYIFDFAFEVQSDIMSNNLIPKIILGGGEINENWGNDLSATVFEKFYQVNPNLENPVCDDPSGATAERIVNANLNDLRDNGRLGTALDSCLNEKDVNNTNEKKIQFDGIIAVLAGGLILWMMIMYCLDLGVRVVQLTYLQIIAPIPIIMYMLPKKDGAFEKWTKQCLTTFLDLFIRTAIICFAVLIIDTLGASFKDITSNVSASAQGDKVFTGLLYTCLVLGVMTFAKKAGDMLKELFPKGNAASGELGISTKRLPEPVKRVSGAAKGFAVGGAVGLVNRAASNISFARRGKEDKDKLKDRLQNSRTAYNNAMKIANDKTKSKAERANAMREAQAYKKEMSSINSQLKRYGTGRLAAGALIGGTLDGAARGVAAGLTSKEGKGVVSKASKAVMQHNQAVDEWRENGGISTPNRMISGVMQGIGISPTIKYDTQKEKYEKENSALGKVTEYFGKGKEAIVKDIDDGKCDGISAKAREYRLKQIEAERLTAQAGNLKLTDFAYKDASERQNSKSKIASILKTPQQVLAQADYDKLDTAGKIEYNKNQKLMALAEQYYDADPNKVSGKKLQDLTGQEKENAISRMLDRLADSACEVSYEETVKEYERQSNDAKSEVVKLLKEATQDVGDKVMSGGVKDASGQVIYQNAKAAQFISLMKDAVNDGSADADLLLNQNLTTFANLDDLNKAAGTRQNANAGELYRMQQSAEYKAAQANKKYNESGKK